MTNQLTVSRRRLTIALAVAAPLAIGLGIGLGELQWRSEGAAISLPEMCVEASPNGDTAVSLGACASDSVAEI